MKAHNTILFLALICLSAWPLRSLAGQEAKTDGSVITSAKLPKEMKDLGFDLEQLADGSYKFSVPAPMASFYSWAEVGGKLSPGAFNQFLFNHESPDMIHVMLGTT